MTTMSKLDLNEMREAAGQASALMKVFGHRGRLMILCYLADGEKSVGELSDLLQMPQSSLSQHLARMRAERLVETRRESQTVFYYLNSGDVRRVIECLYDIYCPAKG